MFCYSSNPFTQLPAKTRCLPFKNYLSRLYNGSALGKFVGLTRPTNQC